MSSYHKNIYGIVFLGDFSMALAVLSIANFRLEIILCFIPKFDKMQLRFLEREY